MMHGWSMGCLCFTVSVTCGHVQCMKHFQNENSKIHRLCMRVDELGWLENLLFSTIPGMQFASPLVEQIGALLVVQLQYDLYNVSVWTCLLNTEEDRLDIPSESAGFLLVDLQNRLTELKGASVEKCGVVKNRHEISQDVAAAMKRQIQMPQHFINLNDRVEAVWSMLEVANRTVVALVGMGGVGEEGLSLEQQWW